MLLSVGFGRQQCGANRDTVLILREKTVSVNAIVFGIYIKDIVRLGFLLRRAVFTLMHYL